MPLFLLLLLLVPHFIPLSISSLQKLTATGVNNFCVSESCPNENLNILQMTSSDSSSSHSASSSSMCLPFNAPRSKRDSLLRQLVRKSVLEGNEVNKNKIGKELYENATAFLVSPFHTDYSFILFDE